MGWFDDKPSRRCIQRDWAADQTIHAGKRYEPTPEGECSRSRTGKVIKLGPEPVELDKPIYVFNNSWYVRAPLIAGGRAKFRAWNNATEFCDPKAMPPGMCVADFETEHTCVQSPAGAADPFANRFPVELDQVPFFDCFAASPGDESSHGISNHPDFPDKLAEVGFPFAGWHGDPGFINAHAGDFRLRPDSLARGKGCVVTRGRDGSLVCSSAEKAAGPDIGAYQGNALVEGPDYVNQGDERPRLVKADWLTSEGAVRLEISFSTPIQDPPSGAYVALRSADGTIVTSEPCQKVPPAVLDCRFGALGQPPAATATLLVPRSLKSSGGKPVTLWAATVSRVGFHP